LVVAFIVARAATSGAELPTISSIAGAENTGSTCAAPVAVHYLIATTGPNVDDVWGARLVTSSTCAAMTFRLVLHGANGRVLAVATGRLAPAGRTTAVFDPGTAPAAEVLSVELTVGAGSSALRAAAAIRGSRDAKAER
jgi:hypothetical protein